MRWKDIIVVWIMVLTVAIPAMAENGPERHRLRFEFFLEGNCHFYTRVLALFTPPRSSPGLGAGLRLAVKPAFLLELKGAWMPFTDNEVYYCFADTYWISKKRYYMISGSVMVLLDRTATRAFYCSAGITLLIRTKRVIVTKDSAYYNDSGWESLSNIAFSAGLGHRWYFSPHFGIGVGGSLTVVPIDELLKYETVHHLERLITAGVGVFYTL